MKTISVDLTGKTFSYLTVIGRGEKRANTRSTYWDCICSCGIHLSVESTRLRSGRTGSCGCKKGTRIAEKVTRHGHCSGNKTSREYATWQAVLTRCFNKHSTAFIHYGAKGITVCERWSESFDNFLVDMGERPLNTSLDRWPNKHGNYEPGNCRWATPLEQANNTKANRFVWVNNSEMTIRYACINYSLPYQTVRNSLNNHGEYISDSGLLLILL